MPGSPETGRINRGIKSVRPADHVSVPNAIESAGEGWDQSYSKLTEPQRARLSYADNLLSYLDRRLNHASS